MLALFAHLSHVNVAWMCDELMTASSITWIKHVSLLLLVIWGLNLLLLEFSIVMKCRMSFYILLKLLNDVDRYNRED